MRSQPTAPANGLASALYGDTACSLALAAAVAATAPAPDPDAALIAVGERWHAVQAEWVQLDDPNNEARRRETDAAGEERFNRDVAAVHDAAAIPAASFTGLAIKARMLAREMDHDLNDDTLFPTVDEDAIMAWAVRMRGEYAWNKCIVGSLVADLLRLAAEAGQ